MDRMSERYGDCPTCKGHGSIFIRKLTHNEDTKENVKLECPACGGTGFDGSEEAYSRKEDDREHEEYLNSLNVNER